MLMPPGTKIVFPTTPLEDWILKTPDGEIVRLPRKLVENLTVAAVRRAGEPSRNCPHCRRSI